MAPEHFFHRFDAERENISASKKAQSHLSILQFNSELEIHCHASDRILRFRAVCEKRPNLSPVGSGYRRLLSTFFSCAAIEPSHSESCGIFCFAQ